MDKNVITPVTRRKIVDEILVGSFVYHGQAQEDDFWSRLLDLDTLPSYDPRYQTAAQDIYKHRVLNPNDWSDRWFLKDDRTNMLRCPDLEFLRFLCETVHPAVQPEKLLVGELVAMYNKWLAVDGYELITTEEISGRPVYKGARSIDGVGALQEQKKAIIQYLDGKYIQQKLALMYTTVQTQTDVAIGLAKELLETTCQSIIHQHRKAIDKEWSIQRLMKETIEVIDLSPKDVADPEKAEMSMKKVLQGLNSIVQGVAELRNSYGSGHGKTADFKGLEPKYAKFIVAVVGEICLLLLASNPMAVELIESQPTLTQPGAPTEPPPTEDLPF
jgi:hypothetical protein